MFVIIESLGFPTPLLRKAPKRWQKFYKNTVLKMNFFFILLIFPFLFSAQNNDLIKIKYQNKINSFSVDAVWKPEKVSYNHVVGPAIVTFKNDSEEIKFSVSINKFSILKSQLPFSYSSDEFQITKFNKTIIELIYDANKFTNDESDFGKTNVPFFFQDIDFDNEKELIFTEIDNGQRGVATFKVFGFDYGDLESELYGKTYKEPYISLDEMSKIDYDKKRIIIYGSGGICNGSYTFYELLSAKNEYDKNSFHKIGEILEVRDDNANKCYQKTYKIIEERKELVSTKQIQ